MSCLFFNDPQMYKSIDLRTQKCAKMSLRLCCRRERVTLCAKWKRKIAASATGRKTKEKQVRSCLCLQVIASMFERKNEPVLLWGREAGLHWAFCGRGPSSAVLSAAAGRCDSEAGWPVLSEKQEGALRARCSLSDRVHQSSEQRKKLVFFDRFSVIFTGPPAPEELLSFIFLLSFVIISRASVKNASSTFVLDFALVSRNLIP